MKTFKIVIKEVNSYVKEIRAKDFVQAKQKGKDLIWHDRYNNGGIDYNDIYVDEVLELQELLEDKLIAQCTDPNQ